jgi:hypothetical protein
VSARPGIYIDTSTTLGFSIPSELRVSVFLRSASTASPRHFRLSRLLICQIDQGRTTSNTRIHYALHYDQAWKDLKASSVSYLTNELHNQGWTAYARNASILCTNAPKIEIDRRLEWLISVRNAQMGCEERMVMALNEVKAANAGLSMPYRLELTRAKLESIASMPEPVPVLTLKSLIDSSWDTKNKEEKSKVLSELPKDETDTPLTDDELYGRWFNTAPTLVGEREENVPVNLDPRTRKISWRSFFSRRRAR